MRIHTLPDGRKIHVGGRKRPATRKKRYLSRYLGAGITLPTAPDFDHTVYAGATVPGLLDILGNDRLGDCTACGALHLTEAINAAAGAPIPAFVQSDAVGFYELSTGYNPADPSSDQGGDEVAVLTAWARQGLDGKGGHAIEGFFDVHPGSVPALRSIAWMFGGLYFGVELPDAYLQIPGSGYVWGTGTPNPANGHCFVGLGATASGILVDSWGLLGTITYEAIAELCTEANGGALYALLTQENMDRANSLCPAGIDWATLLADFEAEGGEIIRPTIPSAPPSEPTAA